jgi:hypothetical protein
MNPFVTRPLTWLLVVATVCVDLVVLAVSESDAVEVSLVLGQSFAAGGWLVLGRAHRLLRGGAFVAALLALAALVHWQHGTPSWGESLGVAAVVSGSAAATTWLAQMLLALALTRREASHGSKRQFPLIEIFGWTIVVAAVSAVLRVAVFYPWGQRIDETIAVLLIAATAGLAMAMFLGNPRPRRRAAAAAAGALVLATFAAVRLLMSITFDGDVATSIALAYAYVGCFILVQLLDDDLARRRGVDSPPAPSLAEDE